ncbi:MAG: spore germination protein [Armatimonadetes bacterium]|nr:spore germination protein [Armatimonadota bacterium]
MPIWDTLVKMLVFQPPQQEPFELLGPEARGRESAPQNQGPGQNDGAGSRGGQKFRKPRRALPVSAWYHCGGRGGRKCSGNGARKANQDDQKSRKGPGEKAGSPDQQEDQQAQGKDNQDQGKDAAQSRCANIDTGDLGKVSANLRKNLKCLKETFHVPVNRDVIFREFTIGTAHPVAAAAIYIDGMTDRVLQNLSILEPLMLLAGLSPDEGETLLDTVIKHLLPGNQVDATAELRDVVDGVLMGSTAVLIDYCPKAVIVETKGWEHRQVSRPANEMVIRGPQEGFTETLRVNTALIRKSLHSPNLITEFFKIGRINRLDCAVMYIAGLTNEQLLAEVKRRIQSVTADYVGESGMLEQFIEDNHFILVPQTVATERPDRVIAGLMEGQAAVLVDGNPYALLVPATFFNVFQNPEDAYVRWPFGGFLRYIRLLGLFLATFLPGLYIAVVTHHHEMIPTDLLLAISANRENVPFPSIIEVLIMEISFELIREAGIRIPGPIGPTLGIVGALILGQAAVAANIVSPILIIIVAVTAIGGFTVSNYSLSLAARFLRFFNILLGAFMGIYGLILGVFIHLHYLAAARSFGVPYLAPLTPQAKASPDLIYRGPVWRQQTRPEYLQPGQPRRQPFFSRGWLQRRGGKGRGGRQ